VRGPFARAVRIGLVAGVAAMFVSAVGMVEAFSDREVMGTLSLGYVLIGAIPVVAGVVAGRPRSEPVATQLGWRAPVAGAVAGAVSGLLLAAFVVFVTAVDVRDVLTNVSPGLVSLLAFGEEPTLLSSVLLVAGTGALGALGGAFHLLPDRWRAATASAVLWTAILGILQPLVAGILVNVGLLSVATFLYQPTGGLTVAGGVAVAAVAFAVRASLWGQRFGVRDRLEALEPQQRRGVRIGALLVALILIGLLPRVFGLFLSEVSNTVGLFLVMALGLNIVVGFAGLLDLGYVAFFAVGAYTTAVLTSPTSPAFAPELTFWVALPFVVLAAALAGMLVGAPVLRMRGDYLAVVTLGFGEIARLMVQSDWLKGTFGGARGIRQVPSIGVGAAEVQGPQELFYLIFAFAVLAAYVSYALYDSRIGRAWIAIREDEPVAEAMGVNVVTMKLWAFIIGAVIASFGGALFATKVHSIFPSSFQLIVSITVLVIVIVGGIERVPGVVLGALLLVATPQLLREFEQYRFLLYGALLIFMMLSRPEGLIPSRRRARELHEEAAAEEQFVGPERQRESRYAPEPAAGPR
jgi:branched-chain amino acid transport system permease protein